ncbi:MAG TPA: hypothetical protein VME70_05825 [Mycobacteriales bacterium]|nr:hypothetical protein [Mycobacteriales bacterium]
MIVRILSEGQFDVPDSALDELESLDVGVQQANEGGDQAAFTSALNQLLARVRDLGAPVSDDYIGPSDLVLPAGDMTLEEAADLMTEDGLIYG